MPSLPILVMGPIFLCLRLLRTSPDLPDELFQRTKLTAASRNTSIKNLVIEGLERVLQSNATAHPPSGALERLKAGLHLGGKALNREQIHAV